MSAGWWLKRVGAIIGACGCAYYVLQYILILYIETELLQTYTWLSLSMVCLIGLVVTRWQYGNIPESKPKLHDRLQNNPGDINLPNGISETHETMRRSMGENSIREIETSRFPSRKPPNLEKSLEGMVIRGLPNTDVDLELQLPETTELELAGQKFKVIKGKIKIKTKKTRKPEQQKRMIRRRP